VIDEANSFRLSGTIQRNGEIICDIALDYEHTLPNYPPQKHETGCNLDLSDLSDVRISGEYEGSHSSGRFDETFRLFDISPWTAILRDESLDFGTRIERYFESIKQVDGLYTDGVTINRIDMPDDAVRALKAEIGADIPAELEALITHDISFYDDNYIGPAYQRRRSKGAPVAWPTLIELERENGYRENELPQVGSDLRAWYERVRVVYEHIGDGHAPFVWDPAAAQGEAQFFWLEEDTREIFPFEHLDGRPVNALNTLLTPLFGVGLQEAILIENGLDPDTWWPR